MAEVIKQADIKIDIKDNIDSVKAKAESLDELLEKLSSKTHEVKVKLKDENTVKAAKSNFDALKKLANDSIDLDFDLKDKDFFSKLESNLNNLTKGPKAPKLKLGIDIDTKNDSLKKILNPKNKDFRKVFDSVSDLSKEVDRQLNKEVDKQLKDKKNIKFIDNNTELKNLLDQRNNIVSSRKKIFDSFKDDFEKFAYDFTDDESDSTLGDKMLAYGKIYGENYDRMVKSAIKEIQSRDGYEEFAKEIGYDKNSNMFDLKEIANWVNNHEDNKFDLYDAGFTDSEIEQSTEVLSKSVLDNVARIREKILSPLKESLKIEDMDSFSDLSMIKELNKANQTIYDALPLNEFEGFELPVNVKINAESFAAQIEELSNTERYVDVKIRPNFDEFPESLNAFSSPLREQFENDASVQITKSLQKEYSDTENYYKQNFAAYEKVRNKYWKAYDDANKKYKEKGGKSKNLPHRDFLNEWEGNKDIGATTRAAWYKSQEGVTDEIYSDAEATLKKLQDIRNQVLNKGGDPGNHPTLTFKIDTSPSFEEVGSRVDSLVNQERTMNLKVTIDGKSPDSYLGSLTDQLKNEIQNKTHDANISAPSTEKKKDKNTSKTKEKIETVKSKPKVSTPNKVVKEKKDKDDSNKYTDGDVKTVNKMATSVSKLKKEALSLKDVLNKSVGEEVNFDFFDRLTSLDYNKIKIPSISKDLSSLCATLSEINSVVSSLSQKEINIDTSSMIQNIKALDDALKGIGKQEKPADKLKKDVENAIDTDPYLSEKRNKIRILEEEKSSLAKEIKSEKAKVSGKSKDSLTESMKAFKSKYSKYGDSSRDETAAQLLEWSKWIDNFEKDDEKFQKALADSGLDKVKDKQGRSISNREDLKNFTSNLMDRLSLKGFEFKDNKLAGAKDAKLEEDFNKWILDAQKDIHKNITETKQKNSELKAKTDSLTQQYKAKDSRIEREKSSYDEEYKKTKDRLTDELKYEDFTISPNMLGDVLAQANELKSTLENVSVHFEIDGSLDNISEKVKSFKTEINKSDKENVSGFDEDNKNKKERTKDTDDIKSPILPKQTTENIEKESTVPNETVDFSKQVVSAIRDGFSSALKEFNSENQKGKVKDQKKEEARPAEEDAPDNQIPSLVNQFSEVVSSLNSLITAINSQVENKKKEDIVPKKEDRKSQDKKPESQILESLKTNFGEFTNSLNSITKSFTDNLEKKEKAAQPKKEEKPKEDNSKYIRDGLTDISKSLNNLVTYAQQQAEKQKKSEENNAKQKKQKEKDTTKEKEPKDYSVEKVDNMRGQIEKYFEGQDNRRIKTRGGLEVNKDGSLKLIVEEGRSDGKVNQREYRTKNISSLFDKEGNFIPAELSNVKNQKVSVKDRPNLTKAEVKDLEKQLLSINGLSIDPQSIQIKTSGMAKFSAGIRQADGTVKKFGFSIKDVRDTISGINKEVVKNGSFTDAFIQSGTDIEGEKRVNNYLNNREKLLKKIRDIESRRKALTDMSDNTDYYSSEGIKAAQKQADIELARLMQRDKDQEALFPPRFKEMLSYRSGIAEQNKIWKENNFNIEDYSKDLVSGLTSQLGALYQAVDQVKKDPDQFINKNMRYKDNIGRYVSQSDLLKRGINSLDEAAQLMTSTDLSNSNARSKIQSLLDKATHTISKAVGDQFLRETENVGAYLDKLKIPKDLEMTGDEVRQNIMSAVRSQYQDASNIKIGKFNKEDRSVDLSYKRNGDQYKARVNFRDMYEIDKNNNVDEFSIGYLQTLSHDTYQSPFQKWISGVRGKIGSLSQYMSGIEIVSRAFQEFKQGAQFVSDMDSALTTINQTMSVSQEELNSLGKGAIQAGIDLSTNADNVLQAAAVYANANETADSILEKSKPTIMLANAAHTDSATASSQIQGVVNQFTDLKGQERRIVNSYEKISAGLSLDFAQGINDMAEAVSNAGQLASEAGLSFESFASLTGKVAEVTRIDGSSIGNMLKTTMARISRSSSADPEVTPDDRSKASAAFDSIGIKLYNKKGEYQDLSKTLDMLAAKWDTLTDAEKSYISEQAAGTRGIQIFQAMMNNYGEAMELAKSALEDTDFIDETQQKRDDSVEGHKEKLQARMQSFWSDLIPVDGLKTLYSAGDSVLSFVTDITGMLNKIPFIGGTGGMLGISGLGYSALGTVLDYFRNPNLSFKEALGQHTGLLQLMKIPFKGIKDTLLSNTGSTSESFLKSFTLPNKQGAKGFGKLINNDFLEKAKNYSSELEEVGDDLAENGINPVTKSFSNLRNKLSVSNGPAEKLGALANALGKGETGIEKFQSGMSKLGVIAGGAGLAGLAALAVGKIAKNISEVPLRAQEDYKNNQNAKKEVNSRQSFTNSISAEFSTLQKGIDTFTGKNISLTVDQFERYNEIANSIASNFPSLVQGYTETGNAILKSGDAVAMMNEELSKQKLQVAQDNLNNYSEYTSAFLSQGYGEGRSMSKETADEMRKNHTAREEDIKAAEEGIRNSQSAIDEIRLLNDVLSMSFEDFNEALRGTREDGGRVFSDAERSMLKDAGFNLGMFGNRQITRDEYNDINKSIRDRIATRESAMEEDVERVRSLYSDAVDAYRYSGKSKKTLLDTKDWQNLSGLTSTLSGEQISGMVVEGETPQQYVQHWVDALNDSQSRAKVQRGLSGLLKLNADTPISDLQDFIKNDLPVLNKYVQGFNADQTLSSLGFDNYQDILTKYQSIQDKYVSIADKNKPYARQLPAGYHQEPLGQDGTGYFANRYDKEGVSIVATPVTPEGKVLDKDEMSDYIQNFIDKGEDPEQLIVSKFEGKNAQTDANKYLQNLRSKADRAKTNISDLNNLMKQLGINTNDEMDTLAAMLSKYSDRSDILKAVKDNWMLDNFDLEENAKRLKDLEANVRSIQTAYESLGSAINNSNSSSGMTRQDIDSLDSLFNLDSAGHDKLFENTYMGVRLNNEELERLYKNYKNSEIKKYTDEVDRLTDQYALLNKEIATTTNEEVKRQKLSDRTELVKQIQQAQEIQSMMEGQTNAVNIWQKSQSLTEKGDLYDTLTSSGRKAAETLYKNHSIGTEKFKTYANMWVYDDLTGKDLGEYVKAYESSIEVSKRWLKDGEQTNQGLHNFLTDLSKVAPEFAKFDAAAGTWNLGLNGQKNNELAKALDIDTSLLQVMFDKLHDQGMVGLDFSEESDYLKGMRQEAVQAEKSLGDLTKKHNINLNAENLEDAQKSLDNVNKALSETTDGATREKLSTIKDFLEALKGEYEVDVEVNKSDEDKLAEMQGKLDNFNKAYEAKLTFKWTNSTPASQIMDDVNEAMQTAYEKNGNKRVEIGDTGYNEANALREEGRKYYNQNYQRKEWYYKSDQDFDNPVQQGLLNQAKQLQDSAIDFNYMFENSDKVAVNVDTLSKSLEGFGERYNQITKASAHGETDFLNKMGFNVDDLKINQKTLDSIGLTFDELYARAETYNSAARPDLGIDLDTRNITDVNDLMARISELPEEKRTKILVGLGLASSDDKLLNFVLDANNKSQFEDKEWNAIVRFQEKGVDEIKNMSFEEKEAVVKATVNSQEWDNMSLEEKEAFVRLTLDKEDLSLSEDEMNIVVHAVAEEDVSLEQVQKLLNSNLDKNVVIKALSEGGDSLQQLMDQIDGVEDKDVNVNANAKGGEKVEKLKEDVESVPDKKETTVEARTNGKEEVSAVKQDIESVPEEKKTTVDAEFKGKNNVEEGKEAVESLPSLKEMTINAQTTGKENVDGLKFGVDGLQNKNVGIFASVPPEAQAQVMGLSGAIDGVNDKNVNITADTSGEQDVNNLSGKINKVQGKSVIVQAITNGIGLVQSLINAIAGLRDKSVTISTNHVDTYTTRYSTERAENGAHWTPNGRQALGKVFNGTAHALGTVTSNFFDHARMAFAGGDWGAKQSGKALVGELGPEIRVRGSRYDVLGKDHAEITDIRKGDIIFNHRFCGYKIH